MYNIANVYRQTPQSRHVLPRDIITSIVADGPRSIRNIRWSRIDHCYTVTPLRFLSNKMYIFTISVYSDAGMIEQCNISLVQNLHDGDCENDVTSTWDFLPRIHDESSFRNSSQYFVNGARSCEIYGNGGVMLQTISRAPQWVFSVKLELRKMTVFTHKLCTRLLHIIFWEIIIFEVICFAFSPGVSLSRFVLFVKL